MLNRTDPTTRNPRPLSPPDYSLIVWLNGALSWGSSEHDRRVSQDDLRMMRMTNISFLAPQQGHLPVIHYHLGSHHHPPIIPFPPPLRPSLFLTSSTPPTQKWLLRSEFAMEKKCRFCPRVCHKQEHLDRHERTHTKVRPYRCESCEKHFVRR